MEAKEPRPVPSEDDGEDWVEDVNEGKVLEVVLAPVRIPRYRKTNTFLFFFHCWR